MSKSKCVDPDYAHIWPFAIVHAYNKDRILGKMDINDLSANDIFQAFSELNEREADILTRYLKNGETLNTIASSYTITRVRVADIRDRALRKVTATIINKKNELKDKEDILNAKLAKRYECGIDNNHVFIRQLRFSTRTENCLYRKGIRTLYQLQKLTSHDLLRIRNLGKRSYSEIVNKLDELGIEHNFEKEINNER